MIYFADMIFNKVFFYAQWNDYPKHYLTSLHDNDDTIAIYGDNSDYHAGGAYYIRLRPDFALYDLISERSYRFNMYAASMTPATYNTKEIAYETLELGVPVFGYANNSRYQDYRYFQMNMQATYDITCKRLPGKGSPKFYLKVIDGDGSRASPRKQTRDFESRPNPQKTNSLQNFTLTPEMRESRWPTCRSFK
jgi:hypothetical protein